MSIDYSWPKFSIGDKVENRFTFQTGRVTLIETGRVTLIEAGVRASDDRFFVNGRWHKADELILIK